MYIFDKKIYLNKNKTVLIDLVNFRVFQITPDLVESLEEYEATGNVKYSNHKEIMDNLLNEISEMQQGRELSGLKVHVSNMCNLKCKYCYAHQGDYGEIESIMSDSTADQVVMFVEKLMVQQKISTISFFGGEPLLGLSAIDTICKQLDKYNFQFLLQTNGTLYNDEILRLIEKFNVKLTVSLDGNQEINDENRLYKNGTGTYNDIVRNINKLNSGNKKYVNGIQATMSVKNQSKIRKKDISDYLNNITDVPFIKVEYDINRKDQTDYDSVREDVDDFFKALWENNYILMGDTYNIFRYFTGNKYNDWGCSAGIEFYTITSNGDIFPCQMLIDKKEKAKVGSILDSFEYINKNNIKVLETIGNVRKSSQLNCHKCVAISICQKCLLRTESNYCAIMIFRLEYFLEKLSEYINKGLVSELIQKHNLLYEF